MIVISDTSAITNLAAIKHLQLLLQLYNRVLIPKAVYRELTDIDTPPPIIIEVQSVNWLEVRQVRDLDVVERLQKDAKLDIGESEAIALALELDADLLLIDERRGRAEADRRGLRITGLLGILVEAKHRNLILVVRPLLDALIATSDFRVSPALYEQILNMVNEV